MTDQAHTQCPSCKEDIDPDVCWCGDAREHHSTYNSNHGFIPMGCNCGRVSEVPYGDVIHPAMEALNILDFMTTTGVTKGAGFSGRSYEWKHDLPHYPPTTTLTLCVCEYDYTQVEPVFHYIDISWGFDLPGGAVYLDPHRCNMTLSRFPGDKHEEAYAFLRQTLKSLGSLLDMAHLCKPTDRDCKAVDCEVRDFLEKTKYVNWSNTRVN